MSQNIIYILGILLLLYGSFKLMMGVIIVLLNDKNEKYVKENKFLRAIVRIDTSLAGKIFSLSIIVFAIYSIIHGLFLTKTLENKRIFSKFSHYRTTCILYGILGLFMTLFYGFIVFSRYNNLVDHDEKKMSTYKFTGIGTGLFFLISLILTYIYHTHKRLSSSHLLVLLCALSLLITSFMMIVINEFHIIKHSIGDILTMVMIPLATI